MNGSIFEVQGDHATALAIFHDEVHCEIFDEVIAVVAQGLTVERMEERVTGSKLKK